MDEKESKKRKAEPDEDARRERQRQKQAEARARQKAGGLTKREKKALKKEKSEKKDKTAGKVWREKEFKGKGRNDFRKERRVQTSEWDEEASKRRKHEIVIVPIFWRGHTGEEDAVTGEAERIKALLLSIAPRLDIWIDRTHKKSPGQKFAFWETVGVQCRIELGPEDIKKKRCVVATCSPTSLAAKATVSSVKRAQLVDAVQTALPVLVQNKVQPFDREDALADAREAELADQTIANWLGTSIEHNADRRSGQSSRTKAPKSNRATGEGLKIDISAKKSTSLHLLADPASRNDDELDDADDWAAEAESDDQDSESDADSDASD